ncbi:MAG: tRNA (cytidine(56)-2'-O)-methyltransferase [Candidatus Micrarchaeota archaeon]
MVVEVLRLGHREKRDERITTHVCLVARALGAEKIYITGENADNSIESVRKLCAKWGGNFSAEWKATWEPVVNRWKKKGKVVHLTMYGEQVQKKIGALKKEKNVLVVVGGEKVPAEMYKMADYNISVTTQPHSEVAALAVFLDRYFSGKELEKKFPKAKIKIVPQTNGKQVIPLK